MDILISLMDTFSDHILDTRTLKPWFPHRVSFICMSSEKGEKDTKLIKLYEQIIVWESKESWYISTTMDYS